MPPIEILAVDEAAENAAPAFPSVKEAKVKPRRFYALTFRDHLRLLFPFIVAGIIGGVARVKYPYWWPANDLVFFLADAFIVATVLGIALEIFSAKLLVERVSDGLAQRLVGRGLPVEMQAPVRDVVSTDLVRDRYVKSYSFSTPGEGRFQINVEVRYEVRNYSEGVRDYAPEMAVDSFYQPDFRFLEYGIAGRKIYTFSDENLSSKAEPFDELGITRVASSSLPPIVLRPVRAGEKASCQVIWRYGITVPEQYCDVTDLDEATMGATIQVENLPEGLEFVSGGDASLHHEVGSQSWYYEKAFIPGQHMRAWWFRRKGLMRVSRSAPRYPAKGAPTDSDRP